MIGRTNIGGGSSGGVLEDKTVALNMASGDQEITPSAGYDGLSKAKVTRPATLIPENIKNGVSVGGVTGSYVGSAIPNDLDDLVDGTITTFTMPQGKTKIQRYLFYNNTSLTSANLQGATVIEDYAFYGCTNVAITLPSTLTSVGENAFRNAGKSSAKMEVVPSSSCSVASFAFNGAYVSKVKGTFSFTGYDNFRSTYGLQEVDVVCGNVSGTFIQDKEAQDVMTKLHIVINGTVGPSTFSGCRKVSDLSITGNITGTLGSGAFNGFCDSRTNPSANVLELDFSTSTFTSIGSNCFGTSSTRRALYMIITLPSSCTSIGTNAFTSANNCDIYFSSETPPAIQSSTFAGLSGTTLWIPYNSVNAYRTAANWSASAVSSAIKGYAKENTFTTGQTLPVVNEEGYGLTWYSDKACTVQVTTVADATAKLYCVVGTEILAYKIGAITELDCAVSITDGVNTYQSGDTVMKNTVLTIDATPTTAGYVPYMFQVNGATFTPGDTLTVASDISVTAIYWDGEHIPVNPVFGDNSWDIIRIAVRNGLAANLWSVGDTKSVTLTNGTTMTVRIADLTVGRYTLADGTGSSNIVLEFVEQFANTSSMNSSNTNTGGWKSSYMRSTTMASCLALLPQDMKDAISEVAVLSGTGASTTSGTSSSNNKLFLPCEWEILGGEVYSIGSSEAGSSGRFGYYRAHYTAADLIKKRAGSAAAWWLRSPRSGNGNYFCRVSSSGNRDSARADTHNGVAPCFAI